MTTSVLWKTWWWLVTCQMILLACIPGCFATRNIRELVQTSHGVVGVWNKSELQPTMFRAASAKDYFLRWPEVNFYCVDATGVLGLENFTHATGQAILDPRLYHDIGIMKYYEPFYKNQFFWRVDMTTRVEYPMRCEYHDIQDLYMKRYYQAFIAAFKPLTLAMLHEELPLQFAKAVPAAFLIFQGFTFASTCHFWLFRHWHFAEFRDKAFMSRGVVFKWIFLLSVKDNFADTLHILLLISGGGLTTEYMGHSDIRGWRTTAFYNVGVLYKHIMICAIISMYLRQVSLAWFSEAKQQLLVTYEEKFWDTTPEGLPRRRKGLWAYFLESVQVLNDEPVHSSLSDDWRWQRIFGQGAVVLLTGTLLACVEDNTGTSLEGLASLVLATVVVACSWSVGVTAVTLFNSLFYILGQTPTLFKRLLILALHPRRPRP